MVNLDLPILNRVKNILTKTEKIDTDVASVLTKLSEQGVDIDSIMKNIGTSGDQPSAATLFGSLASQSKSLDEIKNATPIGTIKNVQRGSVSARGITQVNISPVNMNKSILLAHSGEVYFSSAGASVGMSAFIDFESNSQIKISGNSDSSKGLSIAWQVAEFY